jgi:hypothetical protein
VVAELADRDAERGGEGAAQGGGEPSPQGAGVGLPQHRAGVVVGVGVAGGADAGVVDVVALPAPAGDDEAAGADLAGVHRPERRRGQREEGAWLVGDVRRDALVLVSGEAGSQEVEGGGGVAVGAGGADGGCRRARARSPERSIRGAPSQSRTVVEPRRWIGRRSRRWPRPRPATGGSRGSAAGR